MGKIHMKEEHCDCVMSHKTGGGLRLNIRGLDKYTGYNQQTNGTTKHANAKILVTIRPLNN